MTQYLLACRSLTYAQRAARVLERSGISAAVTKLPQTVAHEGCGYCLRVKESRYNDALRVLGAAGLIPERIYMKLPDGQIREVFVG